MAPYVTPACPFECCVYGSWRFLTTTQVRATPDASAPVIGRITAGQRVRADRGFVRLDSIGLVLVRRDVRDPDMNAEYRAGDTLLVLDHIGEGYTRVWVRGEVRQLALVNVLSMHGRPAGADTAAMVELLPPRPQWWAHVVLPDSSAASGTSRSLPRDGWVLMSPEVDVRGADACGGPET